MPALPGHHYCLAHQGNHSHYAEENCELCKAQAEIERLRAGLKEVIDECTGFAGCESVMKLTAERALQPNKTD